MRKQVTLLSALMLITGSLFAQKTMTLPKRAAKTSTVLYTGEIPKAPAQSNEKAEGDILWANNFNSSTNWLSTANGGTPAADFGWQIASSPNQLLTWFFDPTAINSTSDGGYAVCENGDPTGAPAPDADAEWILTYDSTFNFSAYSNLLFQFEEYGASFIESQVVEVSADNGTTWIEIGNNADLGQLTANGGSAFPNPTLRTYNVGLAFGGVIPATLKFRFRVVWPGNAGANGGIMYGWFIDDVKFIEGYSNDLKITESFPFVGDAALVYTKFPATQAGTAQATVTANIANVGSASQDVVLTATNGAYSSTGTATLPGYSDDSLVVTSAFTIPTVAGVNNFTATATSNNTLSNTSDDTRTLKFEVTPSIMAVDAFTGAASSMTGGFTGFQGQANTEFTGAGTFFEIFEDGEIGAFEVGIANITGTAQQDYIGHELYAYFYRSTDGGATFTYEFETDPKIIEATNFGKIVKFPLTATIPVLQGEMIIVIGASFVGAEVPIAFSGVMPQDNFVGLAGGSNEDFTGLAPDPATPTLIDAPVVRVDFKSYVGVNEIEDVAGINASPNPFTNATEISFNLKADAEVSIVVTDLAGRVVMTIPTANYNAGAQKVSIDGAALNAGVYNYTLTVGNNVVTKRIVKK
jgi:Secretion system C-terminal sorting domain